MEALQRYAALVTSKLASIAPRVAPMANPDNPVLAEAEIDRELRSALEEVEMELARVTIEGAV